MRAGMASGKSLPRGRTRTHPALRLRRRIELLEEQLLGEEAKVRRLEEQAASTDLKEIISEVSHVSAALSSADRALPAGRACPALV